MATQRTTLDVDMLPELEQFISARVASGRYQTANEVLRAALHLLEQSEMQPAVPPQPGGDPLSSDMQHAGLGQPAGPDFLAGGGEMGALMRAYDWSATTLGSPETWPQSLRTSVRLVLSSPHPMLIWWGPDLIQIYNDANRASLIPDRHPGALGQPGRECWPEIWDETGRQIEQVMAGNGPVWHENKLIPVIRNGRLEDSYWTYSCNPIDEPGAPRGIGGVLIVCQETTAIVLAEQRRAAAAAAVRQLKLFACAPGFLTILRGPDFVFEFVNEACSRLFGDRDYIGRTVREVFPDIAGQGFYELLDRAYGTGERGFAEHTPIRLQPSPEVAATERFLDFIYQPIRDGAGQITGVFVQGHDVTDAHVAHEMLRAVERRHTFRIELDEALRDLADPRDIMATAAERLGRHLRAGRCGYTEIDPTEMFLTIHRDWTDGTIPTGAGRWALEDFPAGIVADYRAGRPARVDDTQDDPRVTDAVAGFYAGVGIRAQLSVPLVKTGRLVAGLYVHQTSARHWTDEDEALVRDVAERTWNAVVRARIEMSLRESAARMGGALAIANLGTFEWNLTTDTVTLDDRSREIFGFGPDEGTRAQDVFDRIHPSDLDRINAEVQATVQNASQLQTEYLIRLPDGRVRTIDSIGQAGLDLNGKVERLFGVFSDITERKQAELTLRRLNETLEQRVEERTRAARLSEDRFRGIFDSTYQLIGLTTLDGTILEANRASLDAAGIDASGAIGLPIWDAPWFHRTPDAVAGLRTWCPAVAAGEFIRSELELLLPDDRLRIYDFSLRPLRNEQGKVAFLVAEGLDITDLRATLDQLRHSQKMEALGQLTGGIAHDFNNMLQGISGAIEMMQRRMERGQAAEAMRYMDLASQSVARAAALTHRLLAFAHRQPLDSRAVDPDALIKGMEDLIRRSVGPGATIELRLQDSIRTVLCDPNQLENVMLNLIVNARDAMPAGGRLTIHTAGIRLGRADVAGQEGAKPGDYVEISVTDTGRGMDESTRARAFEPFFTTKPVGEGTGLGLSQIYGFVRQSSGVVRLESRLGHGTTVRLYLPRCETGEATNAPPAAEADQKSIQFASGTVLLVEDEISVRAAVAERLREIGYQVREASDGTEALRVLDSDARLDILVTDLGLPGGLNGRRVAELARENRPNLPVLFITGYAGASLDEDIAPGMEVIGKPFALDALIASVRRLVNASRTMPAG